MMSVISRVTVCRVAQMKIRTVEASWIGDEAESVLEVVLYELTTATDR